jgi:hypothetical protein
MSKYNLGIVKTSLLNNLNETASIKGFVTILKESNLLKLEFDIFDNIEKAHIPNEDLAIKYIDENVKLLKDAGFTKESFEVENRKFLPLMEGVKFSSTPKKELYEKIHTVLYESLTGKKTTNVNRLHDAFAYVLEHVKNNQTINTVKPEIELPAVISEAPIDFIVKNSIQQFNDKYSKLLSEDEMTILKSIVNESFTTKVETFNMMKENTIAALDHYLSEMKEKTTQIGEISIHEQRELDADIDKVKTTKANITAMKFNESTYMGDVLNLVGLKNELV